MPGPYSYVSRNTSKDGCIVVYGISEMKEQPNDYEKWGNLKYKYRGREFWCRGYYVDTVGKNTKAIAGYIKNQLKEDELNQQLVLDYGDPFTGDK